MEEFILFLPLGPFQNHKVLWGHLENKENEMYPTVAQAGKANPQITQNQEGFGFIKAATGIWPLKMKAKAP